MIYALEPEDQTTLLPAIVRHALALEGVELAMWLQRDAHDAPTEAVIARQGRGELRFSPGGELRDARARGGGWTVEGDLSVLDVHIEDDLLRLPHHPDALARVWAALTCPTSGEVLLSAAPGYEFADWGGQAHVGGGSHGSLRGEDSLGSLLLCGVEVPAQRPMQWAITDVAELVAAHFGVPHT